MGRIFVCIGLLAFLIAPAYAQPSPPPGIVRSGSVTTGHCVQWAGVTQVSDAGAACGSGGGAVSVTGTAGIIITPSPGTGTFTVGQDFTIIPKYSGTPTSGHCVSWGSSATLTDAGAACGSGGGGAGTTALPIFAGISSAYSRPALGAYTEQNATGNTASKSDNTGGGPLSYCVTGTGSNSNAVMTASNAVLSNGTWTVTYFLQPQFFQNTFIDYGIVITDGTKIEGAGLWNSGSGSQFVRITWSSSGGSFASPQSASALFGSTLPTWFRVSWNGSTLSYGYSLDGYNYFTPFTGIAASLTATRVGFGFLNTRDTGGSGTMCINSWNAIFQ